MYYLLRRFASVKVFRLTRASRVCSLFPVARQLPGWGWGGKPRYSLKKSSSSKVTESFTLFVHTSEGAARFCGDEKPRRSFSSVTPSPCAVTGRGGPQRGRLFPPPCRGWARGLGASRWLFLFSLFVDVRAVASRARCARAGAPEPSPPREEAPQRGPGRRPPPASAGGGREEAARRRDVTGRRSGAFRGVGKAGCLFGWKCY